MRQVFLNARVYAKQEINLAWPKDWLGYSRRTNVRYNSAKFVTLWRIQLVVPGQFLGCSKMVLTDSIAGFFKLSE